MPSAQKGKELKPAQEAELLAFKIALTEEMQNVFLNTNRLESLNGQMAELYKIVVTLDGEMMRLALSSAICRAI